MLDLKKVTFTLTENRPLDSERFDPELLEKRIVFAMMTRGNDIYYKTLLYLLQQKDAFKHMGAVLVAKMLAAPAELMFTMMLQAPGEYYHVLDSDVAPATHTTLQLLAHNMDIVVSPLYMYDGCSNSLHLNVHYTDDCFREQTPKLPEEGLERIFSSSFGSLLIKRRVLEMFKQSGESFTGWSSIIDEKFKDAPQDITFFAKARALGFDAYIDWSCEVGTHHKYVELNPAVVETYTAQRLFDLKYGPEEKRKLLGTSDGRAVLANDLKRGFDLERTGSPAGAEPCAVGCAPGSDSGDGEA